MDIPDDLLSYDYYCDWSGRQYSRIRGYVHYYITSDGYVLSLFNKQPKYLKTWTNQHGHEMLRINNVYYSIHRLVAEAFVPNPNNLPIVRHLDDIPWNNDYRNLAWGTCKDNRNDMIRNGNDYRREVYCYEMDRYFRSCADAAKELGVNRAGITMACKGDIHKVKGYHFCYADELDDKLKDDGWLKEYTAYKPVIAIDKDGNKYSFKSRKEAAASLGVSDTGITNVLTGRIKKTGGWRFEEGER